MFWLKRKKNHSKRPSTSTDNRKIFWRQIFLGAGLFILIAVLVFGVWHFTRQPNLQLREVKVLGGLTVAHEEVRSIVETELIGTYFKLIPKRFSWFYPHDRITDSVFRLNRVKNLELEVDKNRNLIVAFEEYRPYGLWCLATDSQVCWLIDREGFAFDVAPALSGSAFVRYVYNTVPERGKIAFDKQFLQSTHEFITSLETGLELFVTHVVLKGDYDLEFVVSGGGRVMVSQSASLEQAYLNLETILRSDDFSHLEPGTFNYIDLRFGDKVFVSEAEIESATTTEVEGGALGETPPLLEPQ